MAAIRLNKDKNSYLKQDHIRARKAKPSVKDDILEEAECVFSF